MNCPSCGVAARPGAEFCPSCLGALGAPSPARPAPSAPEPIEPSSQSPAVVTAAAEKSVSPADTAPLEATATCPLHPGLPAAGTCQRCGRFYCVRCVPDAAVRTKVTCPECISRVKRAEAPVKIKKLRRELWMSFLLMGILTTGLVLFLMMLTRRIGGALGLVPLCGIALLACGVLFLATRRVWVVWIAVAVELLLAIVWLAMFPRVNLILVVFVAFPVVTLFRLHTLTTLEAELVGEQRP